MSLRDSTPKHISIYDQAFVATYKKVFIAKVRHRLLPRACPYSANSGLQYMNSLPSSNTNEKPKKVLDGIQYLRGLCAIIVVVSHSNGIIGKPEYYSRMVLPDWHVASVFAVAAFFAISGFIIVIASLDNSGEPRTSRKEFFRRRFIRIIPFLWICTLGYNLLSWAGTSQFDTWSTLRTLLLSPIGELKPNVAWSLRHEMIFYIIYAFTIMGAIRKPIWLLSWFAVSAIFYIFTYDFDILQAHVTETWFEALKVLMGGDHGANFQFAIGMGFAYLYLLRPQSLPLERIPALAILGFTSAAGVIVTLSPLSAGFPDTMLWTALCIPVLASAICTRSNNGLAGKIGLILGNASFSIYLVHNPVVLILLAIVMKLNLPFDGDGHLAAFRIFTIVAAIIVGVCVHYLVEAPIIRAFDHWTRKSPNLADNG